MDSHTESEEGNMNDRAKALAAAAAAASLPGINYMTARFPMAPGVDMPIMHHIGMPFFPQPGSQFLAPGLSTMPMFLHPASLQRPGQPSSSPVKELRPNIQQQADLNQVAQGVMSHPVLQFPSIYMPQQLTHLPSLSEVQEEAGGAMDGIDKRSPGGHEGLMLPFNLFSSMGQQGMQLTMPQPLQQQQQQQQQPLHAPPQQLVTGKEDTPKALKQPKRALTPYMRFSKEIWQRVKAQNPDLSVCAIGAAIGRMWRELPAIEKEKYNEEFSADKIRYEDELQRYLKATGLQASDLAKSSRNRKKESSAPYPQQSSGGTVMQQLQAANNRQQQQNEHEQQQQHLGATTGLPAFSQIWAAGGVPMMNMVGQQTGVEQQLGGDAGRDSGEQGQSDAAMWQQLQDDDPSGQQPPPMYNLLTIQHVERTRHDGAPPAQAMTWHRPGNIRPEVHSHASPKRHDPTGFSQGLGSNGSRMMLPNGTLLPNNDKKVEAGDSWDILGLSSFADKQQQQQMLEASGSVNGGSGVLLADAGALEAEVGQLRHALSEKTREAQRLASELEQAHELIMQLQQQMAASATDVIQDTTEDMQMTVGQEQLAEGADLLTGQADELQHSERTELVHEQQLAQQQMYLQEDLQQPELVYEQQDGVSTMEGLSDTQQVDQQEFQQPDMLYQHAVTVTEQQQLSEEQELQQNALTASGQLCMPAESLFQQETLPLHQREMLQQEQLVSQGEIAPADNQVYQVQEELPLQTEFSRPEENELLQREQLLPQSQLPEQQHQDEVLREQQEQLQQDEQELSLSEQVASVHHHDSLQQLQCTVLPEQQELQQGNELIKPTDVQSHTDDQQHIDKHLPVSEYAQPVSEHVLPVSDYTQPGSEYAQPGSEFAQPGSEYAQPGSEYVQPVSEQVQPVSQHVQSVSELVQPVSEHVQPVSEHVQALPEHLQFVSEHQAQPVSEQHVDAEQVEAENASVEEHKLGLDWTEELSSREVGDNVQ